jgi:cell division septation protein DedD
MSRLPSSIRARVALMSIVLVAPVAGAQDSTRASATNADSVTAAAAGAIPRPANDSLFRRARRLVSEGNGVAGRALVDSLLAATDPTMPTYGDALYWHGALASTAAAAEGDYRRVIVEYPLAYYSGDALLAIAELEQARGDRAGAMEHLRRFVREHPENPGRGLAALGVARLAFEQQDSVLACSMLGEARRSASASDVELRNQIGYFSSRCASVPNASVATTASAPVAAAPVAASTAAPVSAPAAATAKPAPVTAARTSITSSSRAAVTTPAPKPVTAASRPVSSKATISKPASTAAKAKAAVSPGPTTPTRHADASTPSSTRYTVQLAAYDTRGEAEAMVKRLAARGVHARVSGTSKPFRVRLGLHASRKDATAEAAVMRKRGFDGFVAEEAAPAGTHTP